MPNDYSSPYGTGNRSSLITVTTNIGVGAGSTVQQDVDGNKTVGNGWYFNAASQDNTGDYLRWQFDAPIKLTGIFHYQSNQASNGNWKIQGSNDGSTWTDVSSSFTWGDGINNSWERTWTNSTAYSYYQIIGVGGNRINGSTWHEETEFKVDTGVTNPSGDVTQTLTGFSQLAIGDGATEDEDDVVLIIIQ